MDKILTSAVGVPRSWKIGSYKERGGYASLDRAFKMERAEIIAEVKKANLRGRGGAGFPCGVKWGFLPKESNVPKYLVINADEGEPGTFKDHLLMELDPHRLIEGCIISGYAMNMQACYIFIRGEMYQEEDRVQGAIDEAYRAGLLGEDIGGTGWDYDIYVHMGAGAYICGEETALIEALEGKAGQPRLKPPFPAVVGVFSCPTIVNNVETIACVPTIVERGGDWWFQQSAYFPKGLDKLQESGFEGADLLDNHDKLADLLASRDLGDLRELLDAEAANAKLKPEERKVIYEGQKIAAAVEGVMTLVDQKVAALRADDDEASKEDKKAREAEAAQLESDKEEINALLAHKGGGGPKMVGLSGHVNNPGVFEVPHGLSLKELIYSPEYGDGIRGGKELKGVIPGGASCPVLLPDQIDHGMDFSSMTVPEKDGGPETMLGTACAVVMDEDTCMVRTAANLAHFYHHESCGQCTPCREGSGWTARVLDAIENGAAEMKDVELLLDICDNVEGNTICPFGDALAMSVRSYVNKYREEFIRHVEEGGCPHPSW